MANREDLPPGRTLAQLEAELAASEADIKAGRTVALAPVLERLRAGAALLEARRKASAKV